MMSSAHIQTQISVFDKIALFILKRKKKKTENHRHDVLNPSESHSTSYLKRLL